ncbi:MAG: hypothetical protein M5U26_00530 [Planctomycetota bacterium]|nr:hypothetical protein [Planctomycetota bacterium]
MRALLTYRDAQLKLRWDPASLGVQPGDVVEVEVLYCPYGWMFPDELSEGWEAYYDAGFETPSFPFCSNRARYVFPRQAEAKP